MARLAPVELSDLDTEMQGVIAAGEHGYGTQAGRAQSHARLSASGLSARLRIA